MHRLTPGEEIADVVAPYAAVDRSGRSPWVLANMVGSLDGSAAVGGRVGVLSKGADAELFRLLRSVADVVLVGAETVRRERYGPVRLPDDRRAARVRAGRAPVPALAIVTRSLDLDWSSPAFAEADPASPTFVVTGAEADPARLDAARRAGDVLVAGGASVDLRDAIARLGEQGHRVVLCEGGPTLLGELVELGLLDELCLTIAPVMGGDALPVSVSPPGAALATFHLAHVAADGDTLFLRYERSNRAD